jgi:hypothetical protein
MYITFTVSVRLSLYLSGLENPMLFGKQGSGYLRLISHIG